MSNGKYLCSLLELAENLLEFIKIIFVLQPLKRNTFFFYLFYKLMKIYICFNQHIRIQLKLLWQREMLYNIYILVNENFKSQTLNVYLGTIIREI